mmetsp:Transcript_145530/g.253954  ORF Transcript_145530/g.253954 Transcript_145530/m.253954 type:complete len:102 (+) Transcript_145530:96-401(+)
MLVIKRCKKLCHTNKTCQASATHLLHKPNVTIVRNFHRPQHRQRGEYTLCQSSCSGEHSMTFIIRILTIISLHFKKIFTAGTIQMVFSSNSCKNDALTVTR